MKSDMNVVIFATKTCHHRSVLEKYLQQLGVEYQVAYFEDHPQRTKELSLRHSPNLIVNGEVVFEDMPSLSELRRYFGETGAGN